MRVVFMGTPQFSVPALEAIAIGHEVVAVYAQPDRPVGRGLKLTPPAVKIKALELGFPVEQPLKLTPPEEVAKLASYRPDVIVVVAYGQILRTHVLNLPKWGCVNIHASLLPRWRGAAPIQWSILAGDAATGITTMKMVEGLDAGGMYEVAETPIAITDTSVSLHDRLSKMGAELIVQTLAKLESGNLIATPQNESLVTLAPKLTKEMQFLDWGQTSVIVDRQIRALNPWPGTVIVLENGAKIKIKRARLRENITTDAGLLTERAGMLLLGTAHGSLECLELQEEGGKVHSAAEFVRGFKGRGQSLPIRLKSAP